MPPRGTTRATVSADWLNLCQQPYCLVGVCLLRRRLGPPPKIVVGVSKGIRLLNLCSKNLVMTANKKQMAPSPRQPLSGQGVRRISGLGGMKFGSWNVGSICGRGTEVCEELRKRNVDVCCIQEVRWRGEGARFMGVKERRYKFWWSGNDARVGGVGILAKEELCSNVVEVRRRSDRVMSMVMMIGKEIMRVICAYGPQCGRSVAEKQRFYDELACEWDLKSNNEMVMGLGDFNGHVGQSVDGFENVHGGNGVGERNMEGRLLLEFCDEKELCVANTWFKKKEERKITYRSGGNGTEIDFVLVGRNQRKYVTDVKVIPGELQHGLIVANVRGRKLKRPGRKTNIICRRVWKLKEEETKSNFKQRVRELVDMEAPDLWKSFKEGVLKACDELCGKKTLRRHGGNTWWWNDNVKDAIARKKEAYKTWCNARSEENKEVYDSLKKKAKKVVARTMKIEAEKELNELGKTPNSIFKFLKSMKRDGKDVEGGSCLRDSAGRLAFSEDDRKRVWKEHMEKIMNEENVWDQVTDADMVEGPIERITPAEVLKAIKVMKTGRAAGLSEVNIEMINASGQVGVEVMTELCQKVLDGAGMPDEWKTSVMLPIFKRKGDIRSCASYRGVKLLEHGMKVVERVLEKRIRGMIALDDMQFGFMPGRGTIDALFVVRRLQEVYREMDKCLYMCFVDLEKAFDRVPRKVVEWALRKRCVPEGMVKAVMSLYEGATTKVRVGSGYSDEFSVTVGVHQGSVLSPLLFAIVMDVVTEKAREGLMNEVLYADDLVLMGDSMEELRYKFGRWRESLECKGLKVNNIKTKVMVSGTDGEIQKSKTDPCGVCGRRVMVNSLLCTKCGCWIHGRCAKIKRVSGALAKGFVCEVCRRGMTGTRLPQEKLCDGVETVKSFCYLGDRLNASGGSEAAVTARTRIGWLKFRECGEVLYGRRFSLKIKGRVYQSYVRSAILYGSETWCLTEGEVAILRRTERAMLRAMCGVKLMDKKITKELMEMLGLVESLEMIAKANAVRWYGHVLRREDGNILRKALDLEVMGKRRRGRPKSTWKRKVEEEVKKLGLEKEDALDREKWRRAVWKCSQMG